LQQAVLPGLEQRVRPRSRLAVHPQWGEELLKRLRPELKKDLFRAQQRAPARLQES